MHEQIESSNISKRPGDETIKEISLETKKAKFHHASNSELDEITTLLHNTLVLQTKSRNLKLIKVNLKDSLKRVFKVSSCTKVFFPNTNRH